MLVATPSRTLFRQIESSQALLVLSILALNLMDAFFTLRHLAHGAEELNPLMAELLAGGGLRFVAIKHLLVSLGVLAIVLRSDVRWARFALTGVFGIFTGVVVYQTTLLLAS